MSNVPLRIAILECDTPLPDTRARYGSYGGVFRALLGAAAAAESPARALTLTTWDVVGAAAYPALADCDAILITGSRHNSFDDAPWIQRLVRFTQAVLAQRRVRLLGICFGHQIVGRALELPLGRSPAGWEVSVTALDLTPAGQEIFGTTSLALHQMHRDAILQLPAAAGLTLLASTPACPIQGLHAPGRLLTVQGHPEFTAPIVRELLTARHATGILDDVLFADGWARVEHAQDGVLVARAFLRFVAEE